MKAKVKTGSIGKANVNASLIYKEIEKAGDMALRDGAYATARNAKIIMNTGSRSGKTYDSNKGDGSKHTASAPGEPLSSDTGKLANSIRAQRGGKNAIRRGKGVKVWHVGSPLKYMRWEIGDGGGKVSGKGAARPTLISSILPQARFQEFKRKIKEALK